MTTSVPIARLRAQRVIDAAAGVARLRYITDVPGQQVVYLSKREQAVAYLAAHALDAEAVVPPYIEAEAAALGVSGATLAQQVVDIAAVWEGELSPAIEAARIGGKAAVEAAEDLAAVETARDAAVAALAAI